jgi:hypothetical protein
MNTLAPEIVVVDDQRGHAMWLARRINEKISARDEPLRNGLRAEAIYPHDLESGELFISRVIDFVSGRKEFVVYKHENNPPVSLGDLRVERVLSGSNIATAILDWLVIPPHASDQPSTDGIGLARDLKRMRPSLKAFLVTAFNPHLEIDNVDGIFEKEALESDAVLENMVTSILNGAA